MRRYSQGLSTFRAASFSFGMQVVELSGPRFLAHAVKLVAGPVSAGLLICAVVAIGAFWWMFKRYERQLLAKVQASHGRANSSE
jgi:hypothetical protein